MQQEPKNRQEDLEMAHSVKEMPTKKRDSKNVPGPDTKMNHKMYHTRIALSDDTKKKVVEVMQERLAEALDMYSQAKFAHWNVKGINFYQLHLVFDSVAEAIFPQIDAIAERLTQLGGVANGMDHVNALANALGCYCESLREASDKIDEAGDEPTSDFFKQLVVEAEEQLYFLESHLEAGRVE
jgi:starvation-inducible DNA-binding protein